MKIDALTKQKLAIAMDIAGYEQEGNTLSFINVAGDGSRITFNSWQAVCEFIVDWGKKNGFGN